MTWEIRIWHEESADRTRLVVEAGPDVPEDVIGGLAAAYWDEEVRYAEAWIEEGTFEPPEGSGPGGLHG
jgi:hypothetical protein